ncbi:uncharacterized protein LOC141631340 [Silene latifolia]|uniref:uncharacterized protein LOC141631340 n=1 Tax=Silene latifolia TaxID=37657 RepID=UPI003D777E93
MKIGVWNIRGMNKELKQHEIVDFFIANKLDIMGINETRVRFPNFSSIRKRDFKHFNILHNYDYHSNGRLWVIWNKASLVVTALASGVQWVHLQVEAPGCVTYQVTFVYGLYSLEGRVDLWNFMKGVKPTCPWVCLGDFNCVRNLDERISNTAANLQALVDFNDAITMAGLEDMVTHGFTFTWTNKQEDEERKWMKLDRVLINTEWAAVFSHSYADSLAAGVSDHSPLVVSIPSTDVPRPKQLRFLNCWAQDPSFPDIVKGVWQERIQGCSMYKLVQHLKVVKQRLKVLHHQAYSSLTERAKKKKSDLQDCQGKLQRDPMNADLMLEEKDLCLQYCNLKNVELSAIKDIDPNIILSGRCLGAQSESLLIQEVSEAEIHDALFAINVNKSPGPDGFSSGFFRQSWDIIKVEFTKAILDFFRTGKLLKEIN